MPRRPIIIAGIVVVALVGAFVAVRIAWRDTTTPLSAEEAVTDAGGRTTTTTVPGSGADPATTGSAAPPVSSGSSSTTTTGVPEFEVGGAPGDPGLYVYRTTGFEAIDALGGARHDYPAETFITIQAGGCGNLVRWAALAERWSEDDLCLSPEGYRLEGFRSYHEWFGRSDLQEFDCDVEAALVVPDESTGSWSYTCDTGERIETWMVDVVGIEPLDVGGESVDGLHVKVSSQLEGASQGGSVTDTWYLPGTALVLRKIVASASVNESIIGEIHYTEEYEILLTSLVPTGG